MRIAFYSDTVLSTCRETRSLSLSVSSYSSSREHALAHCFSVSLSLSLELRLAYVLHAHSSLSCIAPILSRSAQFRVRLQRNPLKKSIHKKMTIKTNSETAETETPITTRRVLLCCCLSQSSSFSQRLDRDAIRTVRLGDAHLVGRSKQNSKLETHRIADEL